MLTGSSTASIVERRLIGSVHPRRVQVAGAPAIGTGTAPCHDGTRCQTLGIPAGGAITVSAGGNTTTYASNGHRHGRQSDKRDQLQTIVGNAAVTASLNRNGDLVLTSKNTTDTITVGGVYASNIGFGVGQ